MEGSACSGAHAISTSAMTAAVSTQFRARLLLFMFTAQNCSELVAQFDTVEETILFNTVLRMLLGTRVVVILIE